MSDDEPFIVVSRSGDSIDLKAELDLICHELVQGLDAANQRIARLEQRDTGYQGAFKQLGNIVDRLHAIESRPGLSYEGTFESGKTYQPGMFLTHQGSLWCCLEVTQKRPGGGCREWRLAVKHGQDARPK